MRAAAPPCAPLCGRVRRRGGGRARLPPRAMETAQLGDTDLRVSRLALGTMTFGALRRAAASSAALPAQRSHHGSVSRA